MNDDPLPSARLRETIDLSDPVARAAWLQEIRAGAAPLADIDLLIGEQPLEGGKVALVVVPVLLAPQRALWDSIVGDSLTAQQRSVQTVGGTALGAQTTARVRWHAGGGSPDDPASEPWVRVDVRATGPWRGSFALAGPAEPLALRLWAVTRSTVLAFAAAEEWAALMNSQPILPWDLFLGRLDRMFSVSVSPSTAIGRMITEMGWPDDPLGIYGSGMH